MSDLVMSLQLELVQDDVICVRTEARSGDLFLFYDFFAAFKAHMSELNVILS